MIFYMTAADLKEQPYGSLSMNGFVGSTMLPSQELVTSVAEGVYNFFNPSKTPARYD